MNRFSDDFQSESGENDMNVLNSAAFARLENAAYASELRQRVMTDNIANAETPHFKRQEVLFEQLLEQSMGNKPSSVSGYRTDARHIAIGSQKSNMPAAKVVTDDSTTMNINENNVDLDREMALLAKNQLNYNLYTKQISHEIKMMRTAIDGRA